MEKENRLNRIKEFVLDPKYTVRLIIIGLILLTLLIWYLFTHFFTYSRYSYVYANIVDISSQVAGPVVDIDVTNNQYVKAGTKLFQIDPRPYEYAVAKARANLQQAEVNYQKLATSIQAATYSLQTKQVNLAEAQDHLKRYTYLAQTGSIEEIKLIDIIFRVHAIEDDISLAQQNLQIAKISFTDAVIKHDQALLNTALYNLNQTTIYAPVNGYVTNFLLDKGEYIHVGQILFAMVDNNTWWVVTRYRETVIRRVKLGDKVKIHIDMYPARVFTGVVDYIGWGINRRESSSEAFPTGLDYIKPTEYWIRIAQRFPVWIRITDVDQQHYPLRVGASARTIVEH